MSNASSEKSALIKRLDTIIQKNELAYAEALREWRENFSLRAPAKE